MSCRVFDRPDLDQFLRTPPLRVTGSLATAVPSLAYEGRLQIRDPIGPCTVIQLDGDILPPGASLFVDNITKEVVLAWPAYQETGVIPFADGNGNFELGDVAWSKGAGWAIENSGGGNDGFGAKVGVFRAQGESFMEALSFSPTFPGQAFTGQVNVQQGASSKHNVGAGIGMRFYDRDKTLLSTQLGTFIDDGSKGAWHMSTGSFQTPAGAWLVRPVIRGNRTRENKPLWVDDGSWTLQGSVGINYMTRLCMTLRVRDSAGRVADWSGCVSVGNPAVGISAAVRHWWNCDETSAATILADQTGNAALTLLNKGNASFGGATLRGAGSTSIRFAGAAGAQSSFFPGWIGETDDYCVAAWVKLDSVTSSAERTIISDAPADDSTSDVNFRIDVQVNASGQAAAFWEHGTGVDEIVTVSNPLSSGVHFLVVSRDAASRRVICHIDGVPVNSVPYVNDPTDGRSPTKRLVLGNIQSAGRPFEGYVQDVAVFDRPLTDAEVSWLYNEGQGRSYAQVTADTPLPTEPLALEYLQAPEYTHDWANLTGWTVTGVQVSANGLYGIAGGNPAAAGRPFAAAAGQVLKVTADIVNVAGNAGTQYVGVAFGGANDGVNASLPTFVGVGIGTTNRRPVRWAGANFGGGVTTGNVELAAVNLPAGTYRATVVVDEQSICVSLQRLDGSAEYVEMIPRSAAPNGGAVTALVVWNGATNGTAGSYVKALGAKRSLTPFRVKSNAAGVIEGAAEFLIHRNIGDGWRLQMPPWMDGLKPMPVVVFFHQATTGNRNSPTTESRWASLRQELSRAGYALLSADDQGDRWGNPASVDNYAALVAWLKARMWVGDVFLLGASMGGLPMFNSITHGTITGVRGAVALSPVCNLIPMRANATFTAAIDAAWGSSSEATLIANSAGYNPTDRAGSDYADLPYRFHIASSDATVPSGAHTQVLEPLIAPYALSTAVVTLGSGHLAAQQYDPAQILPFLAEYRS